MPQRRPAGVAIIATLRSAAGALELVSGCALLAGGGTMGTLIIQSVAEETPRLWGGVFSVAVIVIGALLFIFAGLDFGVAWGMWTLRRWAWGAALGDAVMNLLCPVALSLLSGNLVGVCTLAINGLTIALLLMPEVMRAMKIRLA